jgi:hypothetical protein
MVQPPVTVAFDDDRIIARSHPEGNCSPTPFTFGAVSEFAPPNARGGTPN